MKLLQTQYSNLPAQDVIELESKNGKTIVKQIDAIGAYIQEFDTDINGNINVDKKQLNNALKVVKNPIIAIENDVLVIKNDKANIELKASSKTIDVQIEDVQEWKELDQDFIVKFKEASKFTSENGKPTDHVYVSNNNIYATDNFTFIHKTIENMDGINIIVPAYVFNVIKNPTHYSITNDNLFIKDGSNVAKVKLIDGIPIEFEKILTPITGNLGESLGSTNELKELKESLSLLEAMGHDRVKIVGNKLIGSDEANKTELNNSILISEDTLYNVKLLSRTIIDGQVYYNASKKCLIFKADDTLTLCLGMRG